MRVSTLGMFQQSLENIQRHQVDLASVQNEIGTGQKLRTAAENPANMARAMSLDQTLADIQRYKGNSNLARLRLGQEESALASSNDVLMRVRELLVQANSGSQTAETRHMIASELHQRYDELLSYANSQDASGRYLFAGSDDAGPAFSQTAAGVTYNGDSVPRMMAIGPHRSVAAGDSGAEVFLNTRSGNGQFAVAAAAANTGTAALTAARVTDSSLWDGGSYTVSFNGGNYQVTDSSNAVVASGAYTSGNSIRFRGLDLALTGAPADGDQFSVGPGRQKGLFATLSDAIALVDNPAPTAADQARVQTGIYGAFTELDQAVDHLGSVRATVGNRLAALDEADSALDQNDTAAQKALSGLRDVDYAEAATRLNLNATVLQASQQAFMKVQGLSLFEFLR